VLALGLSIGITLLLERIPVVRGLLLGQWGRAPSGAAPTGTQPDPA
jgi:hypothetical protein